MLWSVLREPKSVSWVMTNNGDRLDKSGLTRMRPEMRFLEV